MEHVPGLGDDAIKSGGNTNGSVQAVVGDRLVMLDYALPDDTVDPYALVVPLMKTALDPAARLIRPSGGRHPGPAPRARARA